MPRQIVPVSDVASILLTQDEGDLRYLPISYTPPPVDLSVYYTKTQSDARYEPIDTMYTKGESDAKYALLAHNHDAAYSPVAHLHDTSYLKLSGGELTGALSVTGEVTTQSGTGGFTFLDRASVGQGWTWVGLTGEAQLHQRTVGQRLKVGTNGTLTLTPAGIGEMGLVVQGHSHFQGGAIWVGTNVSANGGKVILRDDGGTDRWQMGMAGYAGARDWVLYDPVGTINRMTVEATTGTLSLQPATGATKTTALYTNSPIMLGQNQTAMWHPSYQVIGFPNCAIYNNAASANTLEMGANSYVGSDGQRHALVGTIPGCVLQFAANQLHFYNFATVPTGAVQAAVIRFQVQANGNLLSTQDGGGQFAVLAGGGSNVRLTNNAAGSNIELGSQSNQYFHPYADNAIFMGYTALRYIYVAAVNGTIQTCHATMKKNLKPLDPVACTQAVLETDWLSYEYLPPLLPERKEGETNDERLKTLDEYTKKAQESAFARKQNGYALGHPTHKAHALFGLSDRQSANASSDLGILACALQSALQRIAALEGKPV